MFDTVRYVLRSLLRAGAPQAPIDYSEFNMIDLLSPADLDACLSASAERPVFIFKHSTICPISVDALRQAGNYVALGNADQPPIYLVKVVEDRPVSNLIAEQLGVVHKSPQMLLVKDRTVLWSTSHYGINVRSIQEAVAKHAHAHA